MSSTTPEEIYAALLKIKNNTIEARLDRIERKLDLILEDLDTVLDKSELSKSFRQALLDSFNG